MEVHFCRFGNYCKSPCNNNLYSLPPTKKKWIPPCALSVLHLKLRWGSERGPDRSRSGLFLPAIWSCWCCSNGCVWKAEIVKRVTCGALSLAHTVRKRLNCANWCEAFSSCTFVWTGDCCAPRYNQDIVVKNLFVLTVPISSWRQLQYYSAVTETFRLWGALDSKWWTHRVAKRMDRQTLNYLIDSCPLLPKTGKTLRIYSQFARPRHFPNQLTRSLGRVWAVYLFSKGRQQPLRSPSIAHIGSGISACSSLWKVRLGQV